MKKHTWWTTILAICLLWPTIATADDAAKDTKPDAEDKATVQEYMDIAATLAPSLVRVEIELKYDKGEAPRQGRWDNGLAQLVEEERPLEAGGFLLADKTVLVPDPTIHPRFIKGIHVAFGDQQVDATVSAYATKQNALFLELKSPLKGTKPLAFDAAKKSPYLAVSYGFNDGDWVTAVRGFSLQIFKTDNGQNFIDMNASALIVDEEGTPVGVTMCEESPADEAWKGSPLKWPQISAEKMAELLKTVETEADAGILRVSLSFRSPRKSGREEYYGGGEESSTEKNVLGILYDENHVLVLSYLKPKVTARLERIVVHSVKGNPVPATFECSLKDYGAFVAKLKTPLKSPVKLAGSDLLNLRNELLMTADVILQGEKRICYFNHSRIVGYRRGWQRHIYPQMVMGEEGVFVFSPAGKLLAFPIARRQKSEGSGYGYNRYGYSGSDGQLTAAGYLVDVLKSPTKYADAGNVPLTEEEESRLAWMGVLLQPLDRELARINNVSDLTEDGSTGAIVQYVYKDSPAAKAGVEPGWILLRVQVEGEPSPTNVQVEEGFFSRQPFPWDRLDEIPVQAFGHAPTPWTPAENKLTRMLTDFGFGKKFTAEFWNGEKVVKKNFVITQSPPHYESAKRFKSKDLGLTVRNLTYEVRRYLQKKDTAPGVVISKVEPGSKADVAGLKPYEVITQINGQDVKDVAQFEKLLKASGTDLRLSVNRMTRGRQVKITLDVSATQPTTAPAKTPATQSAE